MRDIAVRLDSLQRRRLSAAALIGAQVIVRRGCIALNHDAPKGLKYARKTTQNRNNVI